MTNNRYLFSHLEPKYYKLLKRLILGFTFSFQVLEVKASKRKGPTNYMTCLRQTLKKHYGSKPVGIGGSFLIESGKARLHVMVSICICYVSTLMAYLHCQTQTRVSIRVPISVPTRMLSSMMRTAHMLPYGGVSVRQSPPPPHRQRPPTETPWTETP